MAAGVELPALLQLIQEKVQFVMHTFVIKAGVNRCKIPILWNALSYIRNNIIEERVQKVSGHAEADCYFNYPYDAVEEALANAVYHKSYELGKPIEVQIWPDKIEVLSFPGPVPPVNAQILAENRRIVARDYRNRRVGDFLKELYMT